MVTLAERVAANAPRDPLTPRVPCGYTDAIDTAGISPRVLMSQSDPIPFIRFASLKRS